MTEVGCVIALLSASSTKRNATRTQADLPVKTSDKERRKSRGQV